MRQKAVKYTQYGINNIRGEGGSAWDVYVENRRVQMEESDNHTEHYNLTHLAERQDKAKTETRVVSPKGNEFHETR